MSYILTLMLIWIRSVHGLHSCILSRKLKFDFNADPDPDLTFYSNAGRLHSHVVRIWIHNLAAGYSSFIAVFLNCTQDLLFFGSPRSRSTVIYWTPVLHSKQMDRVCTVCCGYRFENKF
jgi:hypothetical protein